MAPQQPQVLVIKAEHRCRCQKRSERSAAGFFLTESWPCPNTSRRRQRPRVERMIERPRQMSVMSTEAAPWALNSGWVITGSRGRARSGAGARAGESGGSRGGGEYLPERLVLKVFIKV